MESITRKITGTTEGRRYDNDFYGGKVAAKLDSARKILGYIFSRFPAKSVFDLGCGRGEWLMIAGELGATRCVGVDGSWNAVSNSDKSFDFVAVDLALTNSSDLPQEHFDIAFCLEVMEHLPPNSSSFLLKYLTERAPVILFSAAIPGQGGTNHVNEQYQSYWASLFKSHGFTHLDIVRPMFWSDSNVPYWYRQNLLLYVREDFLNDSKLDDLLSQGPASGPLDVVHPYLADSLMERYKYIIKFESTYLFRLIRKLKQFFR